MIKKNANRNIFEPAVKKMNPILEGKIIKRAQELGEAKVNEFRTRKANMFKLNRRTKKGREEFNKIKDDIQLRNDLFHRGTPYWNRKNYYGYFSNDDAIALVEISKQIYAIDKTQPPLLIKGSKFPKILINKNNIKFGIVLEKYKDIKLE